MLISKEGTSGFEELDIGDFFSAFSSRGRSVLMAGKGLNGLKEPSIDFLL
jgi:hypothetical protein